MLKTNLGTNAKMHTGKMNCVVCSLRVKMIRISKYVFYTGVLQIDTLDSQSMTEWMTLKLYPTIGPYPEARYLDILKVLTLKLIL